MFQDLPGSPPRSGVALHTRVQKDRYSERSAHEQGPLRAPLSAPLRRTRVHALLGRALLDDDLAAPGVVRFESPVVTREVLPGGAISQESRVRKDRGVNPTCFVPSSLGLLRR